MADGVRFELTEDLRLRRFSRPLHSAALPSVLQLFHYRGTTAKSKDRAPREDAPGRQAGPGHGPGSALCGGCALTHLAVEFLQGEEVAFILVFRHGLHRGKGGIERGAVGDVVLQGAAAQGA